MEGAIEGSMLINIGFWGIGGAERLLGLSVSLLTGGLALDFARERGSGEHFAFSSRGLLFSGGQGSFSKCVSTTSLLLSRLDSQRGVKLYTLLRNPEVSHS